MRYDLKYNTFSDGAIDRLIKEIIPSAKHLQDLEISCIIDDEVRADFDAALANNKPKKGKKGKKKK